MDTVILAANAYNKIMILHSPKNWGGTRSSPDNNGVCMLGLSAQAMYVLIDLRTVLADCKSLVPAATELSDCASAVNFANIVAPKSVCFKGFLVIIPAPILCNIILTSGTNDPFKRIPIVMEAAKAFDSEHE